MTASNSEEVYLGAVTFDRFNTIHAMVLWCILQYTVAKKDENQQTEIGQTLASYIKLFSHSQHC